MFAGWTSWAQRHDPAAANVVTSSDVIPATSSRLAAPAAPAPASGQLAALRAATAAENARTAQVERMIGDLQRRTAALRAAASHSLTVERRSQPSRAATGPGPKPLSAAPAQAPRPTAHASTGASGARR
jgi:hypothetical protein